MPLPEAMLDVAENAPAPASGRRTKKQSAQHTSRTDHRTMSVTGAMRFNYAMGAKVYLAARTNARALNHSLWLAARYSKCVVCSFPAPLRQNSASGFTGLGRRAD